MRAILIKNNAWGYINGTNMKTEVIHDDETSQKNGIN